MVDELPDALLNACALVKRLGGHIDNEVEVSISVMFFFNVITPGLPPVFEVKPAKPANKATFPNRVLDRVVLVSNGGKRVDDYAKNEVHHQD